MNWYKITQLIPEIIIDMDQYSKEIHETLFNLIEEPFDENQCKTIEQESQRSLDKFITILHANNIHNYDNIFNNIDNIEFIKKNCDAILDTIWNIRSNIIKTNLNNDILQGIRNTTMHLYNLEKCIDNYYITEDYVIKEKNRLVTESFNNMNKIKNELLKLLSSIKQYKGKVFPVIIEASADYDETGNYVNIENGTNSALLSILDKNYYIHMSIYLDGEKIQILGDEVEDFGELIEEFGDVISDIKPFYNLIRTIIKNPNNIENSSEKTITVYTARPIKDFSIFENASEIPVDIFSSTNYNYVEGFAMDNKPRDIWKIRISDKYLINDETNNPNFIFQIYNPSGENKVPIKKIQFINRIE